MGSPEDGTNASGEGARMVLDSGNAGEVSETRGARRVRGAYSLQLVAAAVVAGCFSALLAWMLPMTADEAHNWLNLSSRGVYYVTHHYPVANNHVLYTALQALMPGRLVRSDPLSLRLMNIAFAIALVTLMFHWLVREGVAWPVALVGLLLGGPLTVLYLGVARGYLLGTLLAFLGLHLLAVGRRRTLAAFGAGVLLALSIYTVPTFALGMLAVGILLFWHRRWVDAVVFGGTAAVLALILYLPILGQVVRAGHGHVHYGARFAVGTYSFNVLRNSLYLTAFGDRQSVSTAWHGGLWLAVALPVLCALGVLAYRRRGELRGSLRRLAPGPRDTTVFALVAAYSVGALAVIEIAVATGLTAAPFYRNSLFVAFAVVLWLLRQLRPGEGGWRWRRPLFAAVVAANVIAAAIGISLLLTGRDYSIDRYGDVLIATPPPELRDVSALGATSVVCAKRATSVCTLYAPYLRRRGVRVTFTGSAGDHRHCVTGHTLPRLLKSVDVRRGGADLGLLCEQ
jgi:hypothetical protein